MKEITFITGPVRSGKSRLAVKLAEASDKEVIFLATCKPMDEEMKARVSAHKESRPGHWTTVEEEIDIEPVFVAGGSEKIILMDCLTLWISNLLLSLTPEDIRTKTRSWLKVLQNCDPSIIIVSNEAGWGIVPENSLAREFRDIIGNIHQEVAEISDNTYLVTAGIPLILKGRKINV